MNIKNTLKCSAAALIGAFGVGSATAATTVIYQQPFNNPGATDLGFASVGWTALYHDTSGNLANYSASISGGGTGLAAAQAAVQTADYAYYFPRATVPEQGLFYTEDPSILVGIDTLYSVAFTYIGDMVDASYRVTVKLGGQWYAQATPLVDTRNNPGGGGGYLSYENTMNFTTAANWVTITGTTIGSQMDLGTTPVSDLTGTIQAIGLYLDQTGQDHLRFDNFTVTAIPEPTAAVLGSLGMVLLLRRRRVA